MMGLEGHADAISLATGVPGLGERHRELWAEEEWRQGDPRADYRHGPGKGSRGLRVTKKKQEQSERHYGRGCHWNGP